MDPLSTSFYTLTVTSPTPDSIISPSQQSIDLPLSPLPNDSPTTTSASPTTVNSIRVNATDFTYGIVLGTGSYAKVVHGTHKETTQDYAIKIVDKHFITKHNKVDAVMNEKKVLTICNQHPNLIKLYYTYQDTHSLCKFSYINWFCFSSSMLDRCL